MANLGLFENGSGYAPKMDNNMTNTITEWWNNLSKEELLNYLLNQPNITAEHIRHMLANEDCTLTFGISFSVNTCEAVTDFHEQSK